MKRYAFIPVIAVIALAGCTTEPGYLLSTSLNEKDRALLTDTHAAAEEAKASADAAAQAAKAASDAASKAEADASKAEADAAKAEADAQAANAKVDSKLQKQPQQSPGK